jgi:hypothetical protein
VRLYASLGLTYWPDDEINRSLAELLHTYASLPYAIYRGYGEAALPVLDSAVQESGYVWAQPNCARELVQAGYRSGFAFIA